MVASMARLVWSFQSIVPGLGFVPQGPVVVGIFWKYFPNLRLFSANGQMRFLCSVRYPPKQPLRRGKDTPNYDGPHGLAVRGVVVSSTFEKILVNVFENLLSFIGFQRKKDGPERH